MASHKLSLEIIDTSNKNILKIIDFSVYTNLIAVVCPQLLITVPGFQYSAVIPEARLTAGFSLSLTACDLDIQTTNCDSEFGELPDGVYAIRFQVSPHEYVFVEYNHLRLTKAKSIIQEALCSLDLGDCIPSKEKEERLTRIVKLDMHLEAAKAKVEHEHKPEQGMMMYNYVLKHLNKLTCNNC